MHAFGRTHIIPYAGPSGRVKLAAKRVGEIAKEVDIRPLRFFLLANPHPRIYKKPIQTKYMGRHTVSIETQTPPFAAGQASKSMPRTRRYISMAKKARVTPIPARQASSRNATTQRASPITRILAENGNQGCGGRTRLSSTLTRQPPQLRLLPSPPTGPYSNSRSQDTPNSQRSRLCLVFIYRWFTGQLLRLQTHESRMIEL